jgi:hypothetical protein
VNAYGRANPASVIFTFRNVTPTPEPESRLAQIPVRYVNENGFLLNETVVTLGYGKSGPVYASSSMVDPHYRLISQNPVNVTVNANGTPVPAVVIFTYKYEAPTPIPTAVPTQAPTPVPTMIPTPVPTDVPTAVPTAVPTMIPTEAPTAVPTEAPTPIPTEVPTEIPTEVPTEVPTPVPTEVPTPVPTEVPTEVPTQAPTEAPTEAPKDNLEKYGSSVSVDGDVYAIDWYISKSGMMYVSLKDLCKNANWAYNGQGQSTILGHSVDVSYSDSGVHTLTVDGSSQQNNALVWRGDLVVSTRFLRALGLNVNVEGERIVITTN